jgi:hypothetical protein
MCTPTQVATLGSIPEMFFDIDELDWDIPVAAVNTMKARMAAPPCVEPPAPRHKVTPFGFGAAPTRLDLGMAKPLDDPELIDMCNEFSCDDINSLVRCAFVYQLRKEPAGMYQAFAAHLHQRGRVVTVVAQWLERIVKKQDMVFVFNPLENDAIIKFFADTWDGFRNAYEAAVPSIHFTPNDLFDMVVYDIVTRFFQFFGVDVGGFDEWRTAQLAVLMPFKKRKNLFGK